MRSDMNQKIVIIFFVSTYINFSKVQKIENRTFAIKLPTKSF